MKKYFPTTKFPVSNFSKAKEALAKKYDTDKNGYLSADELALLYVNEVPNARGFVPENLVDVLNFLGVQQKIHQDYVSEWEAMSGYYYYANDWKGNFNIPDLGAGHIKVGFRKYPNQELLIFDIILDLFDKDYLLENLDDARLVVGPKDFPALPGNIEPEKRFVALTFSPSTTVKVITRFQHPYEKTYPNQLVAGVDLNDMKALASYGNGLSFYAVLEFGNDTKWINLNGVPFHNFNISEEDLHLGHP